MTTPASTPTTPSSASKRKRRQQDSPEEDSNGFHLLSDWQEPPREDNLTLYDINRKPRPVQHGRIELALHALRSEFRCVICLGYIRNTRIVMECLHRFCEDCIEKSLRLGRRECPMCRIPIPTRRSVAPDPNFDALLNSMVGQAIIQRDEEEDDKALKRLKKMALQIPKSRLRQDSLVEGAEHATEGPSLPFFLVDVLLKRHPDEYDLEDLQLPFLRLSGAATIETMNTFLQRKLGHQGNFAFMCAHAFGNSAVPVRYTMLGTIAERFYGSGCSNIVLLYSRAQNDDGDENDEEEPEAEQRAGE